MEERLIKSPPVIKNSTSKDGYKVVDYHCPSCDAFLFSTKNGSACGQRTKYCCACGQALTWKDIRVQTYWMPEELD